MVCIEVGTAQAIPMEADDPTGGYMLQAGARICKSLGEEFLPYLSIVMPPLLKSAQLKPDVKVTDVDDDEDDDEDEDVSCWPEPNHLFPASGKQEECSRSYCWLGCMEESSEDFLIG